MAKGAKSSGRKQPQKRGKGGGRGGKANRFYESALAADRLTGGHLQNKIDDLNIIDPEFYWDDDLDYPVERPPPLGLYEDEVKVLKDVRHYARMLDWGIGIGKFQFGRTTILGLAPVAGPMFDFGLSLRLVCNPARGIIKDKSTRRWMLARQIGNFAVNVGLPEVGDVLNAIFKVNTHNARKLDKYLEEVGQKRMTSEWPKKYGQDYVEQHVEKWKADQQKAWNAAKKKKDAEGHCCGCC